MGQSDQTVRHQGRSELNHPNHPATDVFAAARTRRSVRAYKPDPVPIEIVREIVALGRHAPSGSNIQPWHAHVLTGATLGRVGTAIRQAFLGDEPVCRCRVNARSDSLPDPLHGSLR